MRLQDGDGGGGKGDDCKIRRGFVFLGGLQFVFGLSDVVIIWHLEFTFDHVPAVAIAVSGGGDQLL